MRSAASFRRDLDFDHRAHDVLTDFLLVQNGAITEDHLALLIGLDLGRDLRFREVEHPGQLRRLERRVFLQKFQYRIHAWILTTDGLWLSGE